MKEKQHVVITGMFFKEGYDEVHQWIDATYKPHLGFAHWINRHHIEAITEKYGDNTIEYKVAFLHIFCDFLSHLGLFIVPKTKKECEELLTDLMLI